MSSNILVTGITGATGGATGAALTAAGTPYRAMTRRDVDLPQGAEPVIADFDEPSTLERVLDGVRAAFLVTPSSKEAETQQKRFIDIAATAGVQHIVLLSQLAARADSPVRFLRYHGAVEDHLTSSGIGVTILRPNLFMQGLLAFRSQIIESGIISAPIGNARVSAINVGDIGAIAAVALTAPQALGTLTLTGPQALTHTEMAVALGDALGRTIRFTDIPSHAFTTVLTGVLPEWQVHGLVEDYEHYAVGEASAVTDDVRRILGRDPIEFAQFASEVAPLLR